MLVLSPKLSAALIDALVAIPPNQGPIRAVAESLTAPKRYANFAAVQEDAVQTALKAFGLAASDRASRVDLVESQSTALARVPLMEEAVIEHDARAVHGYTLSASHITGRALFEKGTEKLEVFTANRRDLEHVFGVDLTYLNLAKKNIVMVHTSCWNRMAAWANPPTGSTVPTRRWPMRCAACVPSPAHTRRAPSNTV